MAIKRNCKELEKIKKARMEADYERAKEFNEEQARETFEEAKKFVKMIEELTPVLMEERKKC